MAGPVNFSGLASGMDTNGIIEALVKAAREPIRQLQQKRADFSSKSNKLSELVSKLTALRNSARDLDTLKEFRAFSAKSNDETAATAVASSAATAGTYVVKVSSLAQAERTYSKAFAAKNTTGLVAATEALTLQVGAAAAVSVDVTTTDTLETVAQKINDKKAGLTASIVYTGSQYKLLVSGDKAGTANALTFGGAAATSLDLTHEEQAATNATVVMDNTTFTSTTNQLTDMIPGVTLDLKKETGASTVTIKVDVDLDAVQKKLEDLVKNYNSVAAILKREFSSDGKARTDGLMGDAAVRGVQRSIQGILTSEVGGVSGNYTALSRIGVKSNRDGTITLDSAKLREALAADMQGVTDLFSYTDNNDTTDNDGIAVRLGRTLTNMITAPDGMLAARQEGLGDSMRAVDDRVAAMERNLETYEAGLRKQFMAMEEALSKLKNQGSFLAGLS
ncbi:MAG: flagellar filament capping protein FliD [Deltaproteobacteria bacterium]|nr:flagellar filament capping protein FliD [Deltaproteobacteria bacterium]